jgi:hypothetical protein
MDQNWNLKEILLNFQILQFQRLIFKEIGIFPEFGKITII